MLATDTAKALAAQDHKPPRFTRCSDWPMCMCQTKCANADTPDDLQLQFQLGLA